MCTCMNTRKRETETERQADTGKGVLLINKGEKERVMPFVEK